MRRAGNTRELSGRSRSCDAQLPNSGTVFLRLKYTSLPLLGLHSVLGNSAHPRFLLKPNCAVCLRSLLFQKAVIGKAKRFERMLQ